MCARSCALFLAAILSVIILSIGHLSVDAAAAVADAAGNDAVTTELDGGLNGQTWLEGNVCACILKPF